MEEFMQIIIDHEKCTGCGSCVAECLQHILVLRDGKANVTQDRCLKCGHCVAICPAGAVHMEGVEDVILEKSAVAQELDTETLMAHLRLRRSIRRYLDIPVDKGDIEKIIEAGRITPTGSNRQNVRYIVVQHGIDALEDEVLAQYEEEFASQARAAGAQPDDTGKSNFKRGFLFHGAPALILVVSESVTNACLASMSMELMAETLGLGTLYIGLFTRPANQNKALRESLGVAEGEDIAVCLAIGHPAVTFLRSAPRKPANVIWR
ncbi:MAG: nitroreductase family protein [Eggerthellaceae bacterium]|nr:nitroreductase family protein [Eggerthellaceae bacterium]